MSDEATREGQVRSTPEGGPLDAGVPAQEPGAGQVRTTPEAAPLSEGQAVQPPAWREQMRGPIPGLGDTAASGTTAQPGTAPSSATASERVTAPSFGREAQTGDEGRKPPLYIGKPVSELPWEDALKLAAPVVSVAEKLLIKTIDLTGHGLTSLAHYLEQQRQDRKRRG
jgi:hypothetical protein